MSDEQKKKEEDKGPWAWLVISAICLCPIAVHPELVVFSLGMCGLAYWLCKDG